MSTLSSARVRIPRFAEDAVDRARLAVVPRQLGRPAPRVPFAILVGLLLLSGVAGLLLFNTHMQRDSFRATAMERQADRLNAQEQQLRLELDRLRDPQVLAERARRLGMVPPDAPVFLHLTDGSVTGEVLPPTGANTFALDGSPPSRPRVLSPSPVIVRPAPQSDRSTDGGAASGDPQPEPGTHDKNNH